VRALRAVYMLFWMIAIFKNKYSKDSLGLPGRVISPKNRRAARPRISASWSEVRSQVLHASMNARVILKY
jgi:hypothetical protein